MMGSPGGPGGSFWWWVGDGAVVRRRRWMSHHQRSGRRRKRIGKLRGDILGVGCFSLEILIRQRESLDKISNSSI